MKNYVFPLVAGTDETGRVHISQFTMPHQRRAISAPPSCSRNSPAIDRDYLVAIGSTTYQVSIATINGTRFFRLKSP